MATGDGSAGGSAGTGSDPVGGSDSRVERGRSPPDWLVSVVNPVLRTLLRSPLHGLASDHLVLLTVTGRKTGTEYIFPVGYEQHDGTLTVISHDTNWWKNLRDGGQDVALVLRGERRTGHATVEMGNARVAAHVHDYLERNGVGAAGRAGLSIDGDEVPPEAELREAVDHVVVVTIDLEAA